MAGFSKRIEVGVSIYKVGGELSDVHQLQLIQQCSIFSKKKMSFRVPKILGEFNGKICSECISYNLEFQNFLAEV
jgi:hypothetical protein